MERISEMAYYRRSRTRKRSSRYSRSNRRSSVWIRTNNVNVPAVGTAGSHAMDLLPAGDIDPGAIIGSTVTRVRGTIQCNAGAITGVYGGFYVGFAVVDKGAEPLEDLPEPYANRNDVDWMHWEYVSAAASKVGVWNTSDATQYVFTWEYDVKSQRRIYAPQVSLLAFVQINSIPSNPPIAVNLVSSTLLKLS